MRVRVLGGGWYGSHIALSLLRRGHDVELHEIAGHLFSGASGSNPARLHLGFHYPRSKLTRAACQEHFSDFMATYGEITRAVPCNIYAVADESALDFGSYLQVLRGDVEFVTVNHPRDFGLKNVEGAVLTGERHVIISEARMYFEHELRNVVRYGLAPNEVNSRDYDWTIDCTFCANDGANIDRYEPCVMGVLESSDADIAVTIMDGPFPSIYPWNEKERLSSLTSAKFTPLAKVPTWAEAREVLSSTSPAQLYERCVQMFDQMLSFWPAARHKYQLVGHRIGIRAMPSSKADARLVDVVPVGDRALRVRAGKIDAIFLAERVILEQIGA